jgi:hypothetical protein
MKTYYVRQDGTGYVVDICNQHTHKGLKNALADGIDFHRDMCDVAYSILQDWRGTRAAGELYTFFRRELNRRMTLAGEAKPTRPQTHITDDEIAVWAYWHRQRQEAAGRYVMA